MPMEFNRAVWLEMMASTIARTAVDAAIAVQHTRENSGDLPTIYREALDMLDKARTHALRVWCKDGDPTGAHDRLRALQVIANTRHIVDYLEEHDPKALTQVRSALGIKTNADIVRSVEEERER